MKWKIHQSNQSIKSINQTNQSNPSIKSINFFRFLIIPLDVVRNSDYSSFRTTWMRNKCAFDFSCSQSVTWHVHDIYVFDHIFPNQKFQLKVPDKSNRSGINLQNNQKNSRSLTINSSTNPVISVFISCNTISSEVVPFVDMLKIKGGKIFLRRQRRSQIVPYTCSSIFYGCRK